MTCESAWEAVAQSRKLTVQSEPADGNGVIRN